jgi:hypothetical protein
MALTANTIGAAASLVRLAERFEAASAAVRGMPSYDWQRNHRGIARAIGANRWPPSQRGDEAPAKAEARGGRSGS